MTLVVEDGTGLDDANTYASAANAVTYHVQNGTGAAWDTYVTAGASEGALLRATALLDASYAWRGGVFDTEQALGLPRADFTDAEGRAWTPAKQIAKAVDATSLLALHLLDDGGQSGENVVSEKILDYAVTYASGGKQPSYPDVDAILLHIYEGGGLGGGARGVKLRRWS